MSIQSNLLPTSVVNRRFLATSLKRWGVIWAVTALSVCFLCAAQREELNKLRSTSAELAAEASPLRKIQNEQKQMQRQIQEIRDRESWLTDSDSSQTLQLIGIISRAARKNDGQISVEKLDLSMFDRPLKTNKPPPPTKRTRSRKPIVQIIEYEQKMRLNLSGYAINDVAVASFVAVLRESGVFESVELKSTLSHVLNKHETKQYEMTCIY